MTETMFHIWEEAVDWVGQCKCGERKPDYVSDITQNCYCKCGHRRVLWCKFPNCGCTYHGIVGKEGFDTLKGK